jgi:RNA polymerase sigma-70 factor (ECF subfamily)
MPVAADPDRLIAAVRPLVVRYCRARLGTDPVDDVVQEVCLAVHRALPALPPERPFPGFVQSITRHHVDAARKAAARQRDEPVAEPPDAVDAAPAPDDHALRRELTERMARLLRVLPDRQREIVVLRVAVGLTADETAAVVGSTPGAVRVAQHRAFGRLRRLLTERPG